MLLRSELGHVLPRSFYDRDTTAVARELVGKILRRTRTGTEAQYRIVETEAYLGLTDPACHLHGGFSPRTERTWGRPGLAYVYTIYGVHRCLNAVTLSRPPYGAVLIRAVAPMGDENDARTEGSGPGRLCRLLGIGRDLDGHDLTSPPLQIVDDGYAPRLVSGPRIGIRRARSARLRFAERGHACVSSPAPPRFR